MATQATRGYNPLAIGAQRQTANPATTLQLEDKKNTTYRAFTNISLWIFVLGTFVSVVIGIASWAHPDALKASTGLTFLSASNIGSPKLPQDFTLTPISNFSHDVNLKYAFVALAVPACFLGLLFLIVHIVGDKSTGWGWFNIARNAEYAHKAGILIFSSFWGLLVDGPLFAFMYLWAGERSFETIFLTMLLVSLILVFPTFVDVLIKRQDSKTDKYNDTLWGNLKVIVWITSTVLAVSVVFIWVLFLERIMQNGRLSTANTGINVVNGFFTFYITWWTIYHLAGLGRNLYRLHNGENTADLMAARYTFSVINTICYVAFLVFLASVVVVHR